MPERPGESTPRLSSASRTMITSAGANSAPLRRTIRAFRARPNRVSAGRARSRRRHARTSIAAAAATPARISAAAAIPASPILSRAMIHEDRSSRPIATISPEAANMGNELVGTQRQQAGLLERGVELALLGGEPRALGGERRILGWRIGRRWSPELLDPRLGAGEPRLERRDLLAQFVAQRRNPTCQIGE